MSSTETTAAKFPVIENGITARMLLRDPLVEQGYEVPLVEGGETTIHPGANETFHSGDLVIVADGPEAVARMSANAEAACMAL